MTHKFFKAYVANQYPDSLAYTDSSANYRGRYANMEVFNAVKREHLLSVKNSVSVSVLAPIAHTLMSVDHHRGRRIRWAQLARSIFTWGTTGGLTPEDIYMGEADADSIQVIRDRSEISLFIRDGGDLKNIGRYPRESKTTNFKLLPSSMTEDYMEQIRSGLSQLLAIPRGREYSRTYIINMMLAHFIDRGMPIDETV